MLWRILSLCLAAQTGQVRTDGAALLDFAVDAHRENLKNLDRGTIRFELLQGSARNIEDVAAGHVDHPLRSSGRYVFDGKDALYDCRASDEDILRDTVVVSETQTRSSAINNRLLTDGKSTCLDLLVVENGKVVHRPLIEADEQGAFFNENIQFVYWTGEVASRGSRLIEDWEGIKAGSRSLAEARLNEDGTATIVFAVGKTLRRYRIDLERGAVPTSISDVTPDGDSLLEVNYRDIRRVENGAWIPMTKVVFMAGPRIGRRFTITDYERPAHLAKETFVLTFPQPLNIMDRATKSFLRKVTELRLADRGKVRSSPFTVVPISPKNVDAMPRLSGEREHSKWPAIAALAVGLLGVSVAVWLLAKARRDRT